jgi:oligogalacturonide lyase
MLIDKFIPPGASKLFSALCFVAGFSAAAQAQSYNPNPPAEIKNPPRQWIDAATGHRVIRLTDEPGSASFYFNYNPFTPDGKEMVYTKPGGIGVVNLTTLKTRTLENAHPLRTIIVGHKTPTIYYTQSVDAEAASPEHLAVWACNIDTGETRKLVELPPRATVVTINADETLACGSFIEGTGSANGAYDGSQRRNAHGNFGSQNQGEPMNKSQMMERRLAAKLPMTMFTINLQTGQMTPLLEHNTNWLNHMQFSPTDPSLLLYCHEGMWWKVDRIWTMHTDGLANQLVHQRTLETEIAGHEWWAADGITIMYQLHDPKGIGSFVASYNERTQERIWYHYDQDSSSIHHNSSPDGALFCGDGNPENRWIVLCRPELNRDSSGGTLGANLIKTGNLVAERLVNMSKDAVHNDHNYRLEPNPLFTPDMKYIIFRSNFFGPDYAFAVEVAKARQG